MSTKITVTSILPVFQAEQVNPKAVLDFVGC